MYYLYEEEKRYIDYAILVLLFGLCVLQGLGNVQSLFPETNPDSSLIFYQKSEG